MTAEYRTTLDHLFGLRRFGMIPGLDEIRAVLRAMGDPQRRFRSIHVAGSKGKGSVSAIAAAILQAEGRTVGLFTSPHLVSYRERIRVNGRPIAKKDIVEGVRAVENVARSLEEGGAIGRPLTFFELTTALAFRHFAEHGVDAGVVEVGLGGRLDSTNVLDSPVTVVTTIELEHTDILGPTLSHIAHEKAGIFHRGALAVVGEGKEEPRRVLDREAAALGIPVWHLDREVDVHDREITDSGQRFTVRTPEGTLRDLAIPLHGNFQPRNAALAVAAVQRFATALGWPVREAAVRSGLAQVVWPGRLEEVLRRPRSFVDVAHTPESARALAQSLAERFPFVEPSDNVVLFGCLADKKAGEMFAALSPLASTIVLAPVASDRTAPSAALRRLAVGHFPRIVEAPNVPDGFAVARAATGPGGYLIATGSDYLVGEVLRALGRGSDDEPDLSDPVVRPPEAGSSR